jgi:ADP-heptose:LPS heptosyltransferase
MMFFNYKAPVKECYLQLARLLNCRNIQDQLISLPYRKDANIDPYIVINPNSSDLRIERRWEAERFVALIKSMRELYPSNKIYLIGSRSESDYTQGIAQRIPDLMIENTAGKTTIDQLVDLIGNAELVITNDTGPMHIAFATRVKVIALFGPCAPEQYASHENTIAIYKNVYCSPCVHEFERPPCNGDNQCMKLIAVQEVIAAVRTVLNSESATGIIREPIKYTSNQTLGIVRRNKP